LTEKALAKKLSEPAAAISENSQRVDEVP